MNERREGDGLPVPYDHRKGKNFVDGGQSGRPFQLPAQTGHNVSLDIMPSATQEVIVHTSALDRAKGHALSTSVLGVVLGVLAIMGMWALAGEPYLSFWMLVIFWIVFAGVWGGSWALSLIMSGEGVALFEAWRKWNVVDREQIERWEHYKWEAGRLLSPQARSDLRYGAVVGLAIGLPIALAVIAALWGL